MAEANPSPPPPPPYGLASDEYAALEPIIQNYHIIDSASNTCTSLVAVRYKHFIKSCTMKGDFKVGSIREVTVVSGLPASTSTERLEILDDEHHILSFRVVGGYHRLKNYRSVTSVNEFKKRDSSSSDIEKVYAIVLEVDIPEGNTAGGYEDVCRHGGEIESAEAWSGGNGSLA